MLQFFLQQMLEMSPTGLKTCLDMLLHIVEDLQQGGLWDLLNVGGDAAFSSSTVCGLFL
jgi:hypothetical protein